MVIIMRNFIKKYLNPCVADSLTVVVVSLIVLLGNPSRDSIKVCFYTFIFTKMIVVIFSIKNIKKTNAFEVKLKKEVELRKSFLANMSHEFRTPLNGMLGHIEILDGLIQKKEKKEHLNDLKKSSLHLLKIVNEVLDLSQIEAGSFKLRNSKNYIRSFVEDVVGIVEAEAINKNIGLLFQVADDVPDYLLFDELRLKQVLINVIGNAIKFTSEGNVFLLVDYINEQVVFNIEDTGIGINKEKLSEIFNRFERLDSDASRNYEGTGIGLNIVQTMVKAMNGRINLSSQLGIGTSFKLFFPFEEIKENAESNPTLLEIREGLKVLIVDDNAMNRKVLAKALEKLGIKPELAEDGLEAVEAFQYKKYDIVFMDIQMPLMNGIEATKKILKDNSSNNVQIIGVSANVLAEQIQECIEAGMVEYLTKPVSSKKLQKALRDAISKLDHNKEVA